MSRFSRQTKSTMYGPIPPSHPFDSAQGRLPPQGGRRQDATASAWTVNFNDGNVNANDKTNNNFVGAVRGGL